MPYHGMSLPRFPGNGGLITLGRLCVMGSHSEKAWRLECTGSRQDKRNFLQTDLSAIPSTFHLTSSKSDLCHRTLVLSPCFATHYFRMASKALAVLFAVSLLFMTVSSTELGVPRKLQQSGIARNCCQACSAACGRRGKWRLDVNVCSPCAFNTRWSCYLRDLTLG